MATRSLSPVYQVYNLAAGKCLTATNLANAAPLTLANCTTNGTLAGPGPPGLPGRLAGSIRSGKVGAASAPGSAALQATCRGSWYVPAAGA